MISQEVKMDIDGIADAIRVRLGMPGADVKFVASVGEEGIKELVAVVSGIAESKKDSAPVIATRTVSVPGER
jgi:hypothetical protein